MKNEYLVKMIQESQCRWRIESDNGILLSQDIMIGHKAEAEEFVKRYISSYSNWTYELITLENDYGNSKSK